MSDNQARVSVRILEKEYHIACPIEERSDLLDSAEFLNMPRCARSATAARWSGLDRIAVIAALNMANELIRFRNRDSNLDSDVGGRLRILRERVESALGEGPTARALRRRSFGRRSSLALPAVFDADRVTS